MTQPVPPAAAARLVHIDDDPAFQYLLQVGLESEGFDCTITSAESVRGGIALLESYSQLAPPLQPQLIVLDLRLGDGLGYELLTFTKAQPTLCHIPVVMLTGEADAASVHLAVSLGATHCLQKPAGLAQLQQIVLCFRQLLVKVKA